MYSHPTAQGIPFFNTRSMLRLFSSLPQIASLPPVSMRQTSRRHSGVRCTPLGSSKAINRIRPVAKLSSSRLAFLLGVAVMKDDVRETCKAAQL